MSFSILALVKKNSGALELIVSIFYWLGPNFIYNGEA